MGLGEAVSRLIAFAATVYAARVLGAELFGAVAFAAAVVLYFNRVVDGGFELGLGVREIAADPEFLDHSTPTVLTVRTLLAAAGAAAVGAAGLAFLPEPDGAVLAVSGLSLLAVGIGARWVHLGLRRTALVALAAIVGQGTMALLVFGLVREPADVAALPAAQVAGDLVVAAILLVALRRLAGSLPVQVDWMVVRRLAHRAWHLVASALLGIAIFTTGILLVRAFRGAGAAGHYAAAYTLVTFALNVGAMYNLSLLPSLTRLAPDPAEQHRLYHTAMAHVLAFGLPAAAGGSLLGGPVVGTVFGPGYAESALPLSLLLWSLPLNFLRDVALMALLSAGKEQIVFRVTLVSALLSVTLGLGLVPRFGLAGAAVGTLAAESIRLLLAAGFARASGFPLPGVGRFTRVLAATGVMALGLVLMNPGSVWIGVPSGAALYALGLLAMGALRLGGPGLVRLRL